MSALLDLQIVSSIHGSLVNGASCVHLLCLSLSTRDKNVKSKHIIDGEFLRVSSLLKSLLVDDDLVSIDQMLLHLVRKHSFKRTDLIRISDLLDDFSDLIVLMSWLDKSESCLRCFISSKDDISLLSSDWSIFVRLNNNSMASESGKSVNMDSKFNFNKISFFDAGGILLKGRVVSTDLIDGDCGGEGESLEDRFFIINFGEFLVDETVTPQAEFEDFTADGDLFK